MMEEGATEARAESAPEEVQRAEGLLGLSNGDAPADSDAEERLRAQLLELIGDGQLGELIGDGEELDLGDDDEGPIDDGELPADDEK
jgi:hypothetical protein